MAAHAQQVGEVAAFHIVLAAKRRLEPTWRISRDAARVVVVMLVVQRAVNVGDDSQGEIVEVIVFAADHRDQFGVGHVVGPRQVRCGFVADDYRAGFVRDHAGVECVIGVTVRNQDVIGFRDVRVDERGVGQIEVRLRWSVALRTRCPPRELREERVDQYHLRAVGDLPAGIAEVGEADLPFLERGAGCRLRDLGHHGPGHHGLGEETGQQAGRVQGGAKTHGISKGERIRNETMDTGAA